MSYVIDLFRYSNPYGFCGRGCLFMFITAPLLFIIATVTLPLWFPCHCIYSIYDVCDFSQSIEWSKNRQDEYTPIV